jgi:hypothetical protein
MVVNPCWTYIANVIVRKVRPARLDKSRSGQRDRQGKYDGETAIGDLAGVAFPCAGFDRRRHRCGRGRNGGRRIDGRDRYGRCKGLWNGFRRRLQRRSGEFRRFRRGRLVLGSGRRLALSISTSMPNAVLVEADDSIKGDDTKANAKREEIKRMAR